jgi:hypothetical protein
MTISATNISGVSAPAAAAGSFVYTGSGTINVGDNGAVSYVDPAFRFAMQLDLSGMPAIAAELQAAAPGTRYDGSAVAAVANFDVNNDGVVDQNPTLKVTAMTLGQKTVPGAQMNSGSIYDVVAQTFGCTATEAYEHNVGAMMFNPNCDPARWARRSGFNSR